MTNLSIKIHSFLMGLLHREEGQDLVEYAVLIGFIGIVAAVGIGVVLNQGAWETMATEIQDCIQFDTVACDVVP